jgi:hypothetical protein
MSLVRKILILTVLPNAFSLGQGRVEGRGAARRFASPKYGFSMALPVGWGVSPGLDTPVLFHAPPSGTFGQATIPKGGAVITVEPHDATSGRERSAATPEAWALADVGAEAKDSPPVKPFEMPLESRAMHAVVGSYDERTFSPDEQPHHAVAVFWEFDRMMFAAHLRYNVNDPEGPAFERIFLETVRSFRPLKGD